jgi:hypothetical protein
MRIVLVAGLVALVSSSCSLAAREERALRLHSLICADGWPLRVLQDPQCPQGICGYTCAPNRWTPDERRR